MKYKVKLISPGFKNMNTAEFKSLMFRYWFPTLSLPMIASCTPDDFEISFADELFDTINFDETVDLVGITGMTAQITRGYEIADQYRAKGVTVIMGGIHVSTLPNEALEHSDCVIIGEGEVKWTEALNDFKKGKLKNVYEQKELIKLCDIPRANREIYNTTNLPQNGSVNSIQTTRGCPYNCDFCSVSNFFGSRFRLRPINQIIEEVKSLNGTFISIIDDNIIGNRVHAMELFKELAKLNIQWTGQSSINIADDEELLDLCAKSGCNGLLIGIESVNQMSLDSVHKKTNSVGKYIDAITIIQSKGIKVLGSFIFGLDEDDTTIFSKTIEFVRASKIAVPLFNILTPYPGTKVYEKMVNEDRIISKDWSDYTTTNVVFKPKKMSVEELREGYLWAYNQLHKKISSKVNYQSKGWF